MNMLSDGNKKYEGMKVLTFGLPAIKTCPGAGWCKKICYAMRGNMGMPMARKAQERRLGQSKRADFAEKMIAELGRRKSCNMVRIHDSGDFYDLTYFDKWCEVAIARPDITFFAYTKMVAMLKKWVDAGQVPKNLKLIYSYGGKWDEMINTACDRHAKVFENKNQLVKAGYRMSPDNLPLSIHNPDANHEGFVYHGIMKYENCMKL